MLLRGSFLAAVLGLLPNTNGPVADPAPPPEPPTAPAAPTPVTVMANATACEVIGVSFNKITPNQIMFVVRATAPAGGTFANLAQNSQVGELSRVSLPAITTPILGKTYPLVDEELTPVLADGIQKVWYLDDNKIAVLCYSIPSIDGFSNRVAVLQATSSVSTVFSLKLMNGGTPLTSSPLNIPAGPIVMIDPCPPDSPNAGGAGGTGVEPGGLGPDKKRFRRH